MATSSNLTTDVNVGSKTAAATARVDGATLTADHTEVVPFTKDELGTIAQANAANQWGLDRCGFRDAEVLKQLHVARLYDPIGLIDIGDQFGHPELNGCLAGYRGPKNRNDSIADHAASVAAIICAKSPGGGIGNEDMDGCCNAKIVLYNVWTRNGGLDQDALCEAFEDAVRHRLPVVNVSIWLDEPISARLAKALADCEAANVVVVAAMGNSGTTKDYWPAADTNVIAVAATDPLDRRHIDSTTGGHVHIAAPGQNILTVHGDDAYNYVSGTSFAAPFVTAAVWLAKRERPDLTNQQVRDLLQFSVAKPDQPHNDETGYGRLDMTKLVAKLATMPVLPRN